MSLHDADLAAYFRRIGYSGQHEPRLLALRGIVAAHSTAIPFENLDVLLGRRIGLDIGAVVDKLVQRGRGGYCSEHNSTEICVEAAITVVALYLLVVHTITAGDRSFLSRELLRSPNFVVGTVLMFLIGGILSGTLALIPTMLQHLMHYPVMTTGLVTATRGFGTMAAMFLVGRLIGKVDTRLLILFGLGLTALSLWQMTGFSLQMGMGPVIMSGLLQGFGLGCTFVPLNTIALSTLPRELLT
jgi:MFS transporter, DHA2 family, multidrug resistance protein